MLNPILENWFKSRLIVNENVFDILHFIVKFLIYYQKTEIILMNLKTMLFGAMFYYYIFSKLIDDTFVNLKSE